MGSSHCGLVKGKLCQTELGLLRKQALGLGDEQLWGCLDFSKMLAFTTAWKTNGANTVPRAQGLPGRLGNQGPSAVHSQHRRHPHLRVCRGLVLLSITACQWWDGERTC